ncbi:MAG: bifunctional diaminohydroxyphosphoribosylaminopyrimidine deaminase/5-amino-6-(5-phosphoribosylamino)uracil reductase RibD [Melioribacteraceae bacterium]|nr:bifunctional diaminohydroxyphosphoribosylaminopyrimidine deaminase/5-amino-6-(5-phosphoribosylamino)uracil reductase RibD [Melioribacteraceae bacterium]
MNITHKKYILECFRLAKQGEGFVSPNPLVGAVIVKGDKIISTGYHEKYGSLHAEANAINNAKENLVGATLYCNLEPCSHTDKQTPPCAPLIAKSGIKKVVISNLDPNPKVSGKGIKILQDAGVEVIANICEIEGAELNKFFLKYITQHIPYVTIKIAQSLDGIIAIKNSETAITGEKSREFVHSLRSKYDAVLVGANTIKIDNPQLNVRSVKGRNPIRTILDRNCSIPLDSYVIASAAEQPTWVYTNSSPFPPEIKIIHGNTDINSILKNLGREKITSLLIEGGSNVFSQFIDSELYDELILLIAPKILGEGIPSFISQKTQKLKLIASERLGEDIKLVYRKF